MSTAWHGRETPGWRFVDDGYNGATCTSEDGMKWAEFFSKRGELRMDVAAGDSWRYGMEHERSRSAMAVVISRPHGW
jgi:hypothetical protein